MANCETDMFNLNHPISRTGFHSEKYDLREKLFGTKNVLPMWVADMDLPTPPFILNAIRSRLNHPILGYTIASEGLFDAIVNWQAQHGYEVDHADIVFTHNVANGFYMAVQAFSEVGDSILVQPPVYPPFMDAPEQNDRKLVEAPLKLEGNRYYIDFDAFEKAIVENNVKLFLLCNPQNPSGRVWSKSELEQLVDICDKYGVIIISDEIHSDMVYAPSTHIPTATISEQAKNITVTLSSPGKTFNLGGLQIGYAITANPELKAKYLNVCKNNHIDSLNLFAQIALVAAYTEQGKEWRNQLLKHFNDNIETLEKFLASEFPEVKLMKPEAGYLVWLDFRGMFASHETLKTWLVNEARLGLNDGQSFGGKSHAGDGFMRINLAVANRTLQQALNQLSQAKKSLKTA